MDLASSAISENGLGFITTSNWDPVHGQFGAAQFLYGTAVSSFGALLLATPLSIAIALFLTELAPRGTRTPVGTLVELLAGIPSVILGLWGILVLGSRDAVDRSSRRCIRRCGWIPVIGGLFAGDSRPLGCSRRW